MRDGAVGLRAARAGPARLRLAGRHAAARRVVAGADGRRQRAPTWRPRATTPSTWRSGSGTSSWSPATRRSPRGCGRWSAAGIEFALGLQAPGGEIIWRRRGDGTADDYALLTGCASMYQGLRCAIALADHLGERPARLGAGRRPARARGGLPRGRVRGQEPVLDGLVLPGARRPAARRRPRSERLTPRLGHVRGAGPRRPLRQRRALGDRRGDLRAGPRAGRDRRPGPGPGPAGADPAPARPGGGYWTGWQFANQAHFPQRAEQPGRRPRSSWPPTRCPARPAARASSPTSAAGSAADAAAELARPRCRAALRLRASADPVPGPLKHS